MNAWGRKLVCPTSLQKAGPQQQCRKDCEFPAMYTSAVDNTYTSLGDSRNASRTDISMKETGNRFSKSTHPGRQPEGPVVRTPHVVPMLAALRSSLNLEISAQDLGLCAQLRKPTWPCQRGRASSSEHARTKGSRACALAGHSQSHKAGKASRCPATLLTATPEIQTKHTKQPSTQLQSWNITIANAKASTSKTPSDTSNYMQLKADAPGFLQSQPRSAV